MKVATVATPTQKTSAVRSPGDDHRDSQWKFHPCEDLQGTHSHALGRFRQAGVNLLESHQSVPENGRME
jgi:hypothetical protein